MPKPPVPELVDFDDYKTMRRRIFDKVADAASKAFPVDNERFSLSVEDVAYAGPESFTRRQHRDAILRNRSLTRQLRGRYVLRDKATGNVVSRSNPRTLAHVPYLTDHGTFVRDGVEYAAIKQLRLQPGVYVMRSADGFPQAQFNVAPGTGSSFKALMDPETGVFHLNLNRRKLPAYPILKAAGVSDDEMRRRWGAEIWKANAAVREPPQLLNWMDKAVERGLKDLPDTDDMYEQKETME